MNARAGAARWQLRADGDDKPVKHYEVEWKYIQQKIGGGAGTWLTTSARDRGSPWPKTPQRRPQDSRGFFMLPQAPMDSGYYVYGDLYKKPAKDAYQYAHPTMMTAILLVALEWRASDNCRFGRRDISLTGGAPTQDHKSHKSGLGADIRPLRKDSIEAAVRWWESEYDKEGTERLIELFHTFAPVVFVYFNGADIRA